VIINQFTLLSKTNIRDKTVFAVFAILVTTFFQLSNYMQMAWNLTRLTVIILMMGQFYLTAYLNFSIRNYLIRNISYLIFHCVNFFLFKEIIYALTPYFITAGDYFLFKLIVLFALILLGRNIRLYATLAVQLDKLEKWSQKKILFEKPEKLKIHLGEPGFQILHPNEIIYIRTKAANDHTKIFGIKSSKNAVFKEYSTSYYRNFEAIGKVLAPFPQFKRISQSTVINFKYHYEEKNGSVIVEGRRFAISEKYIQPSALSIKSN
jgi:hypothetical protein